MSLGFSAARLAMTEPLLADPINQLMRAIMNDDKEKYEKMMGTSPSDLTALAVLQDFGLSWASAAYRNQSCILGSGLPIAAGLGLSAKCQYWAGVPLPAQQFRTIVRHPRHCAQGR